MILGFDIDGCITNIEEFDKIHITNFCNQRNIPIPENFLLKHHFGLSDEDYQNYMNYCFPELVQSNPPRPYTSEIFHRLKMDGHTIIIITARDEHRDRPNEPYKGWDMKRDTLRYFEKHDIPYDKIIFSSTSNGNTKGKVCKENHIDLMLEDDVENIKDIVNHGIECVVMKRLQNQDLDIKNITFINNMLEYWLFINKRSLI